MCDERTIPGETGEMEWGGPVGEVGGMLKTMKQLLTIICQYIILILYHEVV